MKYTVYPYTIVFDFTARISNKYGYGQIGQTRVIKQLMEKNHEFQKDVHMLFMDFKAAYHSVNGEKLRNVMSWMGIPERLIGTIRNIIRTHVR